MEPLAEGQEIQLRVVKLSGTVVKFRGKENEKDDEGRALYTLHFPEQTIYVRRENLVPIPDPDP
jgi:hypothetical protein